MADLDTRLLQAKSRIVEDQQRAQLAFEALAAAERFDEAREAWGVFLTHWKRALNRCDIVGRRQYRGAYRPSAADIEADEFLAYLYAARNADEHGVEEIVDRQESALAMGAFGGYEPSTRVEPDGRIVEIFTPLSEDPPPFLTFHPEHVRLVPVSGGRGRVISVPAALDVDIALEGPAVTLAGRGLDFLAQKLAEVFPM